MFNLYVDSVTQIVQFMNETSIPFDSHHNAVYGLQQWTTKDIYRSVSLYTDSFGGQKPQKLHNLVWPEKATLLQSKRKRQIGEKATVSNQRRFSHGMKQQFLCDI